MKKWKRGIAFILTLCALLTLLPPVRLVNAAEVIQRYVLDTDGIETNATYLIVNAGTAGSGNALRFRYNSVLDRDLQNQTLTVTSADGAVYIDTGFTNEADCQFQFTGANAGRVTHGNYSLDLENSRYASGTSGTTLTFTHLGNGQYQIHYSTSSWWSRTYYLRYADSEWSRSTTTSSVYLFKLTEQVVGYDVTFDGNGYTSGTLPENKTNLSSGETVNLPNADLRKDVGEDTWLFEGWNTKPDGSGTEYAPEDTIKVTEDITLYAQWYQQTKYSVSMLTYLDNEPTDVNVMAGYDKQFFALLQGGDGTYLPLTRRSTGVYSTKVVENGTYVIYTKNSEGEYEPVHGHTVVIYGQDGTTECMHYSVIYDTNDGAWAENEDPNSPIYHYGDAVDVWSKSPTRAGYRFLGWKDQDGKTYTPEQRITDSLDKTITLTAQWEKLITVTVNVVIDHNTSDGGTDLDKDTMYKALFTLLRMENDVYLPVAERVLDTKTAYNQETNTTTYQVVFKDMPQGVYRVASTKNHYEATIAYEGEPTAQIIQVNLKYTPGNFDLKFNVDVQAEDELEKTLKPTAVNLKVSYWGYGEDGNLGWHIITQQAGNNAPTTVTIGEDGKGSGYFPVWRYWSGETQDGKPQAYDYRVEVTSFVLPDGTIVPATTDNQEDYTIDGSGLYQAKVSIAGDGRKPNYPDGSSTATSLKGAYFDGEVQLGVPTVTVDITPYTVTFDAGEGTVDGQKTVTLKGQFRYPALYKYTAVPAADDLRFIGWLVNGELATDKADQLLDGDVTYTACYNKDFTLSGTVSADASYQLNDETVYINDIDRADKVMVVLQKKVGDVYNDVDSVTVDLTYEKNSEDKYTVGTGSYKFTGLPNDGTEYRVYLLERNYTGAYNNNSDAIYTAEEGVVLVDTLNAKAQVDIHLDFTPDEYQQAIHVDASQIHKDLRPTGVLAQILYRDLGNVHNYQVISQHTVAPFGLEIDLNLTNATGLGFYDVWSWHTNGAPYEYQAQIAKVYGKEVTGAYDEDGLAYTESSPFTVVYGPANNYLRQNLTGGAMLEATLVPKQYPVYLDLNLGEETTTPVVGLEEFMVDDGSGNEQYMYLHTWSFADQFTAYPYREGYVFKGWKGTDPKGTYKGEVYHDDNVHAVGGVVHVGNTLAKEITLVAQWEKLEGTDYTVRHLELNTDKVLRGATKVSGAAVGSRVMAAESTETIEGFAYAGALVNGQYVDKYDNPYMTVTNEPTKNLMIIYYLPDGSDGYTEQVESNLEINKTAVLEDDGTYTITLDTWTKDNPITTQILQNTPLDIVLVLDQSGSLAANNFEYLTALQDAVKNFVESVADHGRQNEVDHRIAMVGYASNASDGHSNDPVKATGGKESDSWVNTGVFDSNGEYHLYNVKGFNYTKLEDPKTIQADGIYYTKVTINEQTKYLLLTHHDEYRHLITEEEARVAILQGQRVYGYVYDEQGKGDFAELTRNSSGLWLYGNKQLYSNTKFFTYHTDVWTHRDGLEPRQIHAYGVGQAYTPADGHADVYTRDETTGNTFEQSIYVDALVPVSLGAAGSGGTNPGLLDAIEAFGADGATRASYGMEMANQILAATPKVEGEDRVRLVVMFTDGDPGHSGFSGDYNQAVTEANNAIAQSYITKNEHDAYVYTIGLYKSAGVEATSDVAYYMNALSSNYPNAQKMDDIKAAVSYVQAQDGTALENNGKFFVLYNNSGSTYYEVKYDYVRVSGGSRKYCWHYTRGTTNYEITSTTAPTVSGGMVGSYTIYQKTGGYAATEHSGYYATTESADHLQDYFEDVMRDITTKITTQIVLHEDTILRDIMGQGLVLTPGTVITAYKVRGELNTQTGEVAWDKLNTEEPGESFVASVTIPAEIPDDGKVYSDQAVNMQYTLDDGTVVTKENVPYIQVYNLNSANPTNPQDTETYHPHTVDVTGYDFDEWYISEKKTVGYKMVVTITRVEATDDVQWGRSTATNNEQSGLWLPADKNENRQLLMPFDQPTTIFVERAYVLDYGKEFTLSSWYFDDEVDENGNLVKEAKAEHVDCNITNGMNWFDPENRNTQNSVSGLYGNTKYGNVQVKDGVVTYRPTTMNWGGYDQFYVFGETWRRTVLAQDANENHNLWNKVTVIPANNIYYEDSFITMPDPGTQNGIEGFTFNGAWTTEGTDSGNTEVPEHVESATYGDVHGWTDSLSDDLTFTDGSAHKAFGDRYDAEKGANAELTFTGTGVEVYTRTNNKSGMVVAVLKRITKDADGNQNTSVYQTLMMDNLAASGDYYHIPTIAFKALPYGTYTLQLIATAVNVAVEGPRYEYYIDGVRIHNPLGNTTNYTDDIVKDAYGLETNAVYTEVRDVLLEYEDFNTGIQDGTDGKMGAVFIDWVRPGQGDPTDQPGQEFPNVDGQPTYVPGTFEKYGPKNEVYLDAGQAIVLKVAEGNNYYVGLKSLTGDAVTVNVTGLSRANPTAIKVSHTTDMYYQVSPVNGYIVIQNGNADGVEGLLSITNLRTTNLTKAAEKGGILPVTDQEAVQTVAGFTEYLLNKPEEEVLPSQPEEQLPSAEEQAQANQQQATVLFTAVRQWLETQ